LIIIIINMENDNQQDKDKESRREAIRAQIRRAGEQDGTAE
jgi:hypothetical protein